MILGTVIRNYKCYKGLNFIPFSTPHKMNHLNLIIGENGTGKSSILEALNVYFNRAWFVFTKDPNVRRTDSLISPIFIMPKSFVDTIWENAKGVSIKKKEIEEISGYISQYLWSFSAQKGNLIQESIEKIRNTLPEKFVQEDFILLIDGVDIDGGYKIGSFEKFETDLVAKFDIKLLKKYSAVLKDAFTYLYIPVETSINDYLRLESEGIQSLMRTDVKKQIDDIFSQEITVNDSSTTIIDFVNQTLKSFVDETQRSIQKIEFDYSFDPEHAVKQKVTPRDLRGQVLSEFFKNRQLKKGETKIQDLSSGQRKKALVDIIYSIIEINADNNGNNLILAIDEPEASLHVNNCFEQFMKLQGISKNNIQTLVTSHWYGAMPTIENSNIIHVLNVDNSAPKIELFDSANVYDNHDAHRIDDINFKSIYDLSSSILSILRSGDKNWLIVEGMSDKYYLEKYFDRSKYRVLSVGGIDRMIDIADFLSIPLSNKAEKKAIANNKKVIFLSDNDQEYSISETKKSPLLKFLRYTFVDGEVGLVDYTERKHGEPLGIEDVMDSSKMWDAMSFLSNSEAELGRVLDYFTLEDEFQYSKFEGDFSFLRTDSTGTDKIKLKSELKNILKPLKTRLAIEYSKLEGGKSPEWIGKLKKEFK